MAPQGVQTRDFPARGTPLDFPRAETLLLFLPARCSCAAPSKIPRLRRLPSAKGTPNRA